MDCDEFAVLRDRIRAWQLADTTDALAEPTKAILALCEATDYRTESVVDIAGRFIEGTVSPGAAADFKKAYKEFCHLITNEMTPDICREACDVSTQIDWWLEISDDDALGEIVDYVEGDPIPLLRHPPPRHSRNQSMLEKDDVLQAAAIVRLDAKPGDELERFGIHAASMENRAGRLARFLADQDTKTVKFDDLIDAADPVGGALVFKVRGSVSDNAVAKAIREVTKETEDTGVAWEASESDRIARRKIRNP